MDKKIQKQIFQNALISLFIYALPVVLMFLSFYFSGQRPWQKASAPSFKSIIKP